MHGSVVLWIVRVDLGVCVYTAVMISRFGLHRAMRDAWLPREILVFNPWRKEDTHTGFD